MAVALFLVGVLALFLAGLVVAVGADESLERRSRFWARVVLFAVVPLASLALVATDAPVSYRLKGFALLFVLMIPALLCVPAALYRRSAARPRPPEHGGDGGSGPGRPPGPRGGGVPLGHAARVRGHAAPGIRSAPPRRRSRAPQRRTPAPPRRG